MLRASARSIATALAVAIAVTPVAVLSASPAAAYEPAAASTALPPTVIDVDWGDTTPQVKQQVLVTGTVTPVEAERTVQLQVLRSASWQVHRTETTDSDGAFSFTLANAAVGTFTYRVVAPATPVSAEGISLDPAVVIVTRRTTAITTNLSPSRAVVGRAAYVSGSVNPNWGGRHLVLQRKVPGRWTNAAPARRISGSTYRFRVPTRWFGSFRYRVVVKSTAYATERVGATKALRVVPAYRPGGRPGQHSFMSRPVPRWDPCQPIRYRVNLRRATRGALKDVKGAIARIEYATGLNFVYAGRTSVVPKWRRGERWPSRTNLVIAWAKPSQTPALPSTGGVTGVGGPEWQLGYVNGDRTPTGWITRGRVVLHAGYKFKPGFGRGVTRGELLMHEIGHAAGLGHTYSRQQLMYPSMLRTAAKYGAGDLAGLDRLGANRGCVYYLLPQRLGLPTPNQRIVTRTFLPRPDGY